MKTLKYVTAGVLGLALLSSCNKDKDNKADEATAKSDVEDVAIAMNGSSELDMMGDMSLEDDPKMKAGQSFGACASFTADFSGATNTIVLDFGEGNCQGEDGKYRRGILEISFPDNWYEEGASHSLTAKGYAINDYVYNGTRTVTNNGLDGNNNPKSTVTSSLTIDKPNNEGKITWNSTRVRTWDVGFADGNPWNNKVSIIGSASGVTAAGTSFEANITDALVVAANCSNITSGELSISSDTFDTRLINYGEGDCDNIATVTVNGNTTTFRLK